MNDQHTVKNLEITPNGVTFRIEYKGRYNDFIVPWFGGLFEKDTMYVIVSGFKFKDIDLETVYCFLRSQRFLLLVHKVLYKEV